MLQPGTYLEESMRGESRLFGAVEAGGTKFVCAIGDEGGAILAESRFPTADPASTLARVCEFFKGNRTSTISALGLACFGPIELDRRSKHFGFIGNTPKHGWKHIDIAGLLQRELACPVGFDTDVNAAALAEHRWGAARETGNLVYVTVGTGIGGGVLVEGVPVHGLMHPEIGHMYPRRHALDESFPGICPYHVDCLEGLASGPAIVARTGRELRHLEPGHPQWQLQADYLGQLCAQLTLCISPERIVIGGGVMDEGRLFPLIRERMSRWLGGYIDRDSMLQNPESYVIAPGLGIQAGVLGALCLAIAAAGR
jgi:fructokinase